MMGASNHTLKTMLVHDSRFVVRTGQDKTTKWLFVYGQDTERCRRFSRDTERCRGFLRDDINTDHDLSEVQGKLESICLR